MNDEQNGALKKVLVVEDDVFLKELLAGKLASDEFNMFYASNGEEALSMVTSESPDIVLLDILLPGMSGFEVLKTLKADEAVQHIPVLILSNFGQSEDIVRAKELGAEDFLVKANNSLDAIVEKVREITSKGPSSAPAAAPQAEPAQNADPAAAPQENPAPQENTDSTNPPL